MQLRGGSHKDVGNGLGLEAVDALRRRFVKITDDDVAKLQRQQKTAERPKLADVVVRDTWEESAIDAKWMVAARLVEQRGHLVIGELRIFPRDQVAPIEERLAEPGIWSAELLGRTAPVPHGGLSARLLRKIRLQHAVRRMSLLRIMARGNPTLFEPGGRMQALGWKKPPAEETTRRTGRSDGFYALLAADYVQAIARDPQRPVMVVAKNRKVPTARVRDMLHQARQRGLLTEGVQGRSGGSLTVRAMELLKTSAKPTRKKKR